MKENPSLPLLHSLQIYRDTWGPVWGDDGAQVGQTTRRFEGLLESPKAFERTHLPGHLTGSAVVLSPNWNQVLLTLHAKLGKWLQLGGHADGDPRLDRVALREAQEESGLHDFTFASFGPCFGLAGDSVPILDLDVHTIPPHGKDPGHEHYDVRFLLVAHYPDQIRITPESRELRWFPVEEAFQVTEASGSMHRLFRKVLFLRKMTQRDLPTNCASQPFTPS